MAQLLWGKVYYQDVFAGYLRQEPGERFVFAYDESYVNSSHPPIAYSMPLRSQAYISEYGLHPFFDNLVSEGWLEEAQARLIGKRIWSRFELLLAFGQDLAGAVSIIDPEPLKLRETSREAYDPKTFAVMQGRASLSGIQPKLTLVKEHNTFRPSHRGELSTYIGKFPSPHLPDIIENEYLTTLACKKLLPEDEFVDLHVDSVEGIAEKALLIKRFDRTPRNTRIHFEEFNQLLEHQSRNKYEGAYKDMAHFLKTASQKGDTIPLDAIRLFNRIIMGIAVGNRDMHFKNFALIYTDQGLRLSPNYDLVSAAVYHPSYQTMALCIGGAQDLYINALKPKNILALAKEFDVPKQAIRFTVEQLRRNISVAQEAVSSSPVGSPHLKDQIIKQMDKRWNGTFSLIGNALLEKL